MGFTVNILCRAKVYTSTVSGHDYLSASHA